MEIRQKVIFLPVINKPIYKFFREFTNHRKKLTTRQFLAVDLSPTFLKTWTTDTSFQQSEKRSRQTHMKSLASMYERAGPQFLTTIAGVTIWELREYYTVSDKSESENW